jgi:hypothetical protein
MSVRNIQYLNRIVDFLVDDTEIVYNHRQFFISGDGDKKIMNTPFGALGWEYFLRNQGTPYILFVEYIENNYGVARSEVRYVWDRYVSKLKDKRYGGNIETITESITSHHQWMMGNPSDFLKLDGVSEDLKQKLIKIIYQTVGSILESMTYELDEQNPTLYVVKIHDFQNSYGLYLENDGTVSSFEKFCNTYMDYILKEMLAIFREYTYKNPSIVTSFGLGSTVLLMNKMGEIFINEQ